mmetsp:Transcript_31689/g.52571  ORF Transcript_31689/g.52571 Transcript_31689/m.52571 type:complete len:83 (+) Transcript_31689:162-410(+)
MCLQTAYQEQTPAKEALFSRHQRVSNGISDHQGWWKKSSAGVQTLYAFKKSTISRIFLYLNSPAGVSKGCMRGSQTLLALEI